MKAKESKVYGTYYTDGSMGGVGVFAVKENEKEMLAAAMDLATRTPSLKVYVLESIGYELNEPNTKFHKTPGQNRKEVKQVSPPAIESVKTRKPRKAKMKLSNTACLCDACALILNCDTPANLKAEGICKEYIAR